MTPKEYAGEMQYLRRLPAAWVLALTAWGEACGEGKKTPTLRDDYVSMLAVMCTARNRVEHPTRWGGDIRRVCLAPWQYSCWNRNDPNVLKLLLLAQDTVAAWRDPEFLLALNLAEGVLNGFIKDDCTQGAQFYYALSISRPPFWDKEPVVETVRIGQHVFGKLGEGKA